MKEKNNLKGYHVSFIVRFDPNAHVNDALTLDGELDTVYFRDYIYKHVTSIIEKNLS